MPERADDEAVHGHSDQAAVTRKDAEAQFEKVARDFADADVDVVGAQGEETVEASVDHAARAARMNQPCRSRVRSEESGET